MVTPALHDRQDLLLQVLRPIGLRVQEASATLAMLPRTAGSKQYSSSSGWLSAAVPALQQPPQILEPPIPWHGSPAANLRESQDQIIPGELSAAAMQPATGAQDSASDNTASAVVTASPQTAGARTHEDFDASCTASSSAALVATDAANGAASGDAPVHELHDAASMSAALQGLSMADWAPIDADKPAQQAGTAAGDGSAADGIMQDRTQQQPTHVPDAYDVEPVASQAAGMARRQPANLALEAQGADGVVPPTEMQPPQQDQQQQSCAVLDTGGSLPCDVHLQHTEADNPPSSGTVADLEGHPRATTFDATASTPTPAAQPAAVSMPQQGTPRPAPPADAAADIAGSSSDQDASAPAGALSDATTDAEAHHSADEVDAQPADNHHISFAQQASPPVVLPATQAFDTAVRGLLSEPAVQASGPHALPQQEQGAIDTQHAAAEADSDTVSAPEQQLDAGAVQTMPEHGAQQLSFSDQYAQELQQTEQLQQKPDLQVHETSLTPDSRSEPQPAAVQLDTQQLSEFPSPMGQQQAEECLPQASDADLQELGQQLTPDQLSDMQHADLQAAPVQPSDGPASTVTSHTDWAALDAASAGRATSADSTCSSAKWQQCWRQQQARCQWCWRCPGRHVHIGHCRSPVHVINGCM